MNEKDLRTLLVRATEDRPAGIDPMPVMTRRPRRILVPSLAGLGAAGLVGVIVTVLPGSQVSAQAQVAAAVDNTGRESYRIHITAGGRTWEGAFDPVRHTGVITEEGNASETRFIGDRMYVKPRGETKWQVQSGDNTELNSAPEAVLLVKLAPQDPQAALQRLRSATDVREDGSASGPGWSGQRYAFSLEGAQTPAVRGEPAAASGTVAVDDQGRVRRLEVTFADNGGHNVMDIGDYGTPVTVDAPPADQVVSKPLDDPQVKPTGDPGRPVDKSTRDPDEPAKTPTGTDS